MVSKNDLAIGILVLIAGIVIYEFTPAAASPGAGGLFMGGAAHATSHYIGSTLAILFGLVGLALYKKVNKITLAVSALSVVLGIVFLLDAPNMALYKLWTPHGTAMATTSGLTLLVGLVGIAGSFVWKKK